MPQKKVSYLEDLADIIAQMLVHKGITKESIEDLCVDRYSTSQNMKCHTNGSSAKLIFFVK